MLTIIGIIIIKLDEMRKITFEQRKLCPMRQENKERLGTMMNKL